MTIKSNEMRITKTFRLKGPRLLEIAEAENIHQLAKQSGVSYQALHRWVRYPEEVKYVDLQTLYQVIYEGMGMTLDDLSLSDLFEVIDNDNGAE